MEEPETSETSRWMAGVVDYGHGRRLSAAVDKPMADAIPESVGESVTVPAVGYRTAPPGQQNKSSTGGGGGGGWCCSTDLLLLLTPGEVIW